MWLKTLKSKFMGENLWLQLWSAEEKRNALWDKIADLIEEIYHQKIPIEEIYIFFTTHSAGFAGKPIKEFAGRKVIAIVKPVEFPEFCRFYRAPETSDYLTQEEGLTPLVNSIMKQVYGN